MSDDVGSTESGLSSSSNSSQVDTTGAEPEEACLLWEVIWPILQDRGWKMVKSGSDLYNFLYLRPDASWYSQTSSRKRRKLGEGCFGTIEQVMHAIAESNGSEYLGTGQI